MHPLILVACYGPDLDLNLSRRYEKCSLIIDQFIFLLQVRKVHGVGDRMWQMFRPLAFKDAWSIIPMLLRPKSRGVVRLRSANPYDTPIFNAGYFSDPRDILVLVEAVKFALALAETKSFKKFGTKFWDQVPMPGCEHTTLWTDEYWACICR